MLQEALLVLALLYPCRTVFTVVLRQHSVILLTQKPSHMRAGVATLGRSSRWQSSKTVAANWWWGWWWYAVIVQMKLGSKEGSGCQSAHRLLMSGVQERRVQARAFVKDS
jgi:hypothetical protein